MPRDLFTGEEDYDEKREPRDLFASLPQPQKQKTYNDSLISQGLSGVNEGISNALGGPVDLANMALGGIAAGANAALGTNIQTAEKPFLGSDHIKEMLGRAGSIGAPTEGRANQVARRVGQGVGEIAPFAAAGAPANIARSLATGVGSGAGGALAQQIDPGNPLLEAGLSIAGGALPNKATQFARSVREASAARKAVPTVDEIKRSASALYDKAEKSGVTANQLQTRSMATRIRAVAENEGLITPQSGNVDASMPKVRSVINMIDEFSGQKMTARQMKSVRRTLQNAAGSADPAEARVGSIMIEHFDDFTDPIAPEFKEARKLWGRAKRAESLETLGALAESDAASNYSQSGIENALRKRYRQLEQRIIKGQERGFSQEEFNAISKVSQGTPASNVARSVGKFAPKGVGSATASVTLPTLAGSAAGDPLAGALIGSGVAGVGATGRTIATKMTTDAARDAQLLVRAGVPIDRVSSLTPSEMQALRNLLLSQGITSAE